MRSAWTISPTLLALVACAAPQGQPVAISQPTTRPAAQPTIQPCIQEGVASWYNPQALHRRTADGEHPTALALTAAHRSLPFGTRVRVTDLDTDRSVVVLINDRGPFARGRIIDLSTAAARALAMRQDGVAHVRLAIDRPSETPAAPTMAAADPACLLPGAT